MRLPSIFKRNIYLKKSFSLFCISILAVSATACLDDDIEEPVILSHVAIYNAATESPDFDIYLNGKLADNDPIKFSDYVRHSAIPAGVNKINFVPESTSDTVASVNQNFKENKGYSIFLVNDPSTEGITSIFVEDLIDKEIDSDEALIRFLHLSPDTAPAYVSLGEEEDPLSTILGFKQVTDFREITAGDKLTFKLRSPESTVIDSVVNVKIEPRKVYNFFIKGLSNPPEESKDTLSIKIISF